MTTSRQHRDLAEMLLEHPYAGQQTFLEAIARALLAQVALEHERQDARTELAKLGPS